MLFSPGWRGPIGQNIVLSLFAAGLVAGGVVTALTLWALSGLGEPIPEILRNSAIICAAILGVLHETGAVRIPLPQNARQIPQDVLQRNLKLGALQFGFELGTGVRTYISSSSPYVVALALLLSDPEFSLAAATGLGFGLGRAVTALVSVHSLRTWETRWPTSVKAIGVGVANVLLVVLAMLMMNERG